MYKSPALRTTLGIGATLLVLSTSSMATEAVGTETQGNKPKATECPDSVPAALIPPADQSLAFKRAATGLQIYACSVKPSGEYTWLFIAPSANLYGDDSTLVGTHSIGPVWQDNDGSLVKGAKAAEAPSPDGSIPWLLLKSVSNSGEGRFSKVSSIQRLNTTGGLAPDLADCTQATLGTIKPVPYTADYYFFETNAPASPAKP